MPTVYWVDLSKGCRTPATHIRHRSSEWRGYVRVGLAIYDPFIGARGIADAEKWQVDVQLTLAFLTNPCWIERIKIARARRQLPVTHVSRRSLKHSATHGVGSLTLKGALLRHFYGCRVALLMRNPYRRIRHRMRVVETWCTNIVCLATEQEVFFLDKHRTLSVSPFDVLARYRQLLGVYHSCAAFCHSRLESVVW